MCVSEEGFSTVLEEIAEQQRERQEQQEMLEAQREKLLRSLASEDEERDLVIGLYKTKRITLGKLDEQMREIDGQENAIRDQLDALDQQARGIDHLLSQLDGVAALLQELGGRVEKPTFETKRHLVQMLVQEITVTTIEENGTKHAEVEVVFKFDPMIACSPRKRTSGSRP